MLAELLKHLKDGGEFLFREHADLEIQVGTALGLAGHAVLADEDEDCKEDAFGGYDQREYAKGKGIEGLQSWNQVQVDQAPEGDQKQLCQQETHAADEFRDLIADSLGEGAAA